MEERRRNYDTDIAEIKITLQATKELTADIHKVIYGDNGNGLTTRVALNHQAIQRAWWWLGSLSGLVVVAVGCVIKKMFVE